MKLIGYWMENLQDIRLPLPHELTGDLPDATRSAICSYLRQGRVFETFRGSSWCRFFCGGYGTGIGHRELTDGEWVWPEGLVHYIQRHRVILPADFISAAVSGRAPAEHNGNEPVSLDFWIQWAASRREPALRQLLAESMETARAAESGVIEEMVADVARREETGIETCQFAGCSEPALTGRRICARHFLNEHEILSLTHHLYQLPSRILHRNVVC